MADVTGPISSLPGSYHCTEEMCDDHPDRKAVKRIQGETDSFGCEMIDMCQECLDKYREEIKNADYSGVCDWCKVQKERLWPKRDYDEGMAGPVYEVCQECSDRVNKAALEELERYEYDCNNYDDYWDYDD